MNRKVYDQHEKAFASVSAYVLIRGGEAVGSVAFKHGTRVRCFLHIHGSAMTVGWAGGGGYDRASAAAGEAFSKLRDSQSFSKADERQGVYRALAGIKNLDTGFGWERTLTDSGFTVARAI